MGASPPAIPASRSVRQALPLTNRERAIDRLGWGMANIGAQRAKSAMASTFVGAICISGRDKAASLREEYLMKLTLAFIAAALLVTASPVSADPGTIWGPGGQIDTGTWVCKPIKGDPSKQRCTRR